MQLSKKTILGITIIGLLAFVSWLLGLLGKGPKYRYRQYRVNGSRLAKILRTTDFDSIAFKPKDVEGGRNVKVELETRARKNSGDIINTSGVITPFGAPLELEELDFSFADNYFIYDDEPKQMEDLLAIFDRNGSDMFFVLVPVNGGLFHRKLEGYLCYKIEPFKGNGDPADIDLIKDTFSQQMQYRDSTQMDSSYIVANISLSLQLNPCPPGSKPR